MKIAIVGESIRKAELQLKFSKSKADYISENSDFSGYDVVIDLNFDDYIGRMEEYSLLKNKVFILSSAKIQLESVLAKYDLNPKNRFFGINAIPGFINRPVLEMCSPDKEQRPFMEEVAKFLKTDLTWVESRVGLVTPRVVFMIINEAFYTLQEGTASKEDIDTGMKLGTNYPFGPFEWAGLIGIKNIYETLAAIYEDTKEERYKICPLLKTEYLNRI